MPRKYTKKKNKKGGTPPKTISNRENIMNDEIIILKNRLDELEAKLEICCRDMVQGANTIQRMTRGHQSRKDTKIMKRGLNPNITDALLDLPQDVGDLIATHRKTIPYIHKSPVEMPWIDESSLKGEKKGLIALFLFSHMTNEQIKQVFPSAPKGTRKIYKWANRNKHDLIKVYMMALNDPTFLVSEEDKQKIDEADPNS